MDAGALSQLVGEFRGPITTAVDQVGQSITTQRTDCCPDGNTTGPPRGFGNQIDWVGNPPGCRQIGRLQPDGASEHLGITNDRDAAVVGDVEPFVSITRPRVGPLASSGQRPVTMTGPNPEPESSVDMEPGVINAAAATTGIDDVGNLGDGIKPTTIHVASLGVDEVIIAGYANGYAGYVTTPEEYEVQDYEGASTHFGKWTLPAWQTIFRSLAHDLIQAPARQAAELLPPTFSAEDLEGRLWEAGEAAGA